MLSNSKRWLVLGGSAICFLAGALLIFAVARTGTHKIIYVYASPNWNAGTIARAKFVRMYPNAKCNIDFGPITQAVSELFGVTIIDAIPKYDGLLAIVALCGIKESTFYKLPAALELWINFCDPALSYKCPESKVFAFSDAVIVTDLPCVKAIILQELVNYGQRRVQRILGLNCH
jgi:hypothetical protein